MLNICQNFLLYPIFSVKFLFRPYRESKNDSLFFLVFDLWIFDPRLQIGVKISSSRRKLELMISF